MKKTLQQSLNQSQRTAESQAGMALLEAGIPLSLLLDLVTLDLTGSRDIAHSERADTGWIHAAA